MKINLNEFNERVAALRAGEKAARGEAVGSLVKYSKAEWEGTPEAIEVAVEALLDPHVLGRRDADSPPFRGEVAKVLGNIGGLSKAVVPQLLKWLGEDQDDRVRMEAIKALGKIGADAKSATRALVKVIRQDDRDALRAEAAWALARIAPEADEATPALTVALQDKNGAVCVSAAEALWKVSHQADKVVPALVHALKDERIRHAATQALYRIGPEARAAVPALVGALKGNDRLFREAIILALRKIDPAAAAKAGVR